MGTVTHIDYVGTNAGFNANDIFKCKESRQISSFQNFLYLFIF
jgi:hypothetical protein